MKTILVVDDTPENLAVMSDLLQPYYQVRVASSGARALQVAASEPKPDLILLDVMMPEMDGYQVLQKLREQPRSADIPVMFVTALHTTDDEQKGLELGAVDYVSKPLRPAVVLARVKTHLELARARKRLAEQNASLEEAVQARTGELRQALAMFKELFERSLDALVMVDDQGVITLINSETERLFGWQRDELMNRPLDVVLEAPGSAGDDKPTGALTLDALKKRERIPPRKRSGATFPAEVRFNQIHTAQGAAFLMIVRDLTETIAQEELLRRAQRMEALGQLAGGIAHDLNNTLGPTLMALDLHRLQYPEQSPEYLDVIAASTARGAAMVRQLLLFAKGARTGQSVVQMRYEIKEVAKMLASTIDRSIEIRTRYENDLLPVLGDATQFHQILLNLCVNARDAMPQGGTLTISADNVVLDDTAAAWAPTAAPGPYVRIRVTDTGQGIPLDIQGRIFDPFFTTKGPDEGTGLGLATVLGIVKAHKGALRFDTAPGAGTTFEVYLPAAAESASAETERIEEPPRGDGRAVLVVDDELPIRTTLSDVLGRWGFRVITAASGTEALARLGEIATERPLLLTDVNMPGMSGVDLVPAARTLAPELPILVMTGLHDEQRLRQLRERGVEQVLQKPFDSRTLARAVREALASVVPTA